MKLGLVLEGGAHRTVFSCGVMDALLDAGIKADYVIGSSAGITYAASYVSQQHGRNREMLRRFVKSPRYQGFHHRHQGAKSLHKKVLQSIHFFSNIPVE